MPEGIYFSGWTEWGIPSPFLSFPRLGIIGFVSNNGQLSQKTVGIDRQGHSQYFYKLALTDTLMVWGFRRQHVLTVKSDWQLMKFDRHLFGNLTSD
jgi:hypothetical protein